jgi:ABC-type sugar transport systems, permease components
MNGDTVKTKRRLNREGITGTVMAVIPIAGFVIFGLIPLIFAVVLSFFKVYGYGFDGAEFVGTANYQNILSDPAFWKSVKNTLLMGISLPVSVVISIVVAYLLTKNIKGKKGFQAIYFIPYICSVVAVTFMWRWIFNTQYGVLNQLLGRTGPNAIGWLDEEKLFILSVIIINIWTGTGFGILLFSAAFTNINRSLIEAAKIDGAGSFKIFFRIVLKSVSPTTFYLFTIGLIGALQMFNTTQILASGGGPGDAGVTVIFYLYRNMFFYVHMMGVASAVACILAVFIGIITAANFFISTKWVSYD